MLRKIIEHPLYELFFAILSLFSAFALIGQMTSIQGTEWMEEFHYFDLIVVSLFLMDYITKFYLAEDKWKYVKTHPIELLSCIPLSPAFQSLRVFQVLRFLRALIIFKRGILHLREALTSNHFILTLSIVMIFVAFMAYVIYQFEPQTFENYGEALWWAYVTATTVGYGDFYPVTWEGRVIGVILMTVGIGLVGYLSATLAAYFLSSKHGGIVDETEKLIIHQIHQLDRLNEQELEELKALIDHMWRRKRN